MASSAGCCCYTSDSCMIRVEGVLIVFVRFISTLKLNIRRLNNIPTLTILILLLIIIFPLPLTLALSSPTVKYMWVLYLALVDKVKVETTIDHIDVAAQVAGTSICYHLAYVLRIGRGWMELVALLAAHVIQQSDPLIAFGYTLIILYKQVIRRCKSYSFAQVERAIGILEVLLESIIHHHVS